MGLGSICYHTENKTCYIPEVCKLSAEKNICQQASKCHLWHVNVYFVDQKIMQRGTSWNQIFKVLKCKNEMYKRIDEKMGSFVKLSCLLSELIIKMSKMVHVLYFLLMTAKNQLQFKFKYMHLKDLN